MTYQPDWDVDRARGKEAEQLYQALRSQVLTGEAEIKRDDRARDTGNFYVEYQCKRRDGWHRSGLATTKAKTWVIFADPVLVAIPVDTLKALGLEHWRAGDRKECTVGSHPTRGVVIPIAKLLPAALRVHTAAHGAHWAATGPVDERHP